MSTQLSEEYRCNCGKLLFKSPGFSGCVEVKCRRCGRIKVFEKSALQNYTHA